MAMKTKKMTIAQIKKKMLAWRDFYGGDIFYNIGGAKTKKDLAEIMDSHFRHLEMCANDAGRHCEEFKRELGLNQF